MFRYISDIELTVKLLLFIPSLASRDQISVGANCAAAVLKSERSLDGEQARFIPVTEGTSTLVHEIDRHGEHYLIGSPTRCCTCSI